MSFPRIVWQPVIALLEFPCKLLSTQLKQISSQNELSKDEKQWRGFIKDEDRKCTDIICTLLCLSVAVRPCLMSLQQHKEEPNRCLNAREMATFAGCLIYAAFMIGFLVIGIIALVSNKFLWLLRAAPLPPTARCTCSVWRAKCCHECFYVYMCVYVCLYGRLGRAFFYL